MSSFFVQASERRTIRRAVRLECQVVRERDFKLVASHAVDLSTEGMLVATDDVVLTGEPMLVSFRAPWTPFFIDSEATVARVVHGRRPCDRGRRLGLSFRPLDRETSLLLRSSLLRMPLAPLPTRAKRIDYAATVRAIAAGERRALRRTPSMNIPLGGL